MEHNSLKITIIQQVKKCLPFMQLEGSLLCSEQLLSELDEWTSHPHTLFTSYHHNIISHLWQGLPSGNVFQPKYCKHFSTRSYVQHALSIPSTLIWPATDNEYKLLSFSLCTFFHPSDQNMVLSNTFSNSFYLKSSLQVPCHKKITKIYSYII
jgi:hypothetical protein